MFDLGPFASALMRESRKLKTARWTGLDLNPQATSSASSKVYSATAWESLRHASDPLDYK
jgi:hypothetical protein